MQYQKLSTRQNLAMTWWNRPGFEDYEGIICDGSIRSGKTVAMTVGFIMWAMSNFSGQNFALCGKTIESLRRNVTSNLSAWLCGVFTFKEHRTEDKIVVRAGNKTNSFYLFGGKDESSQDLIQGITLAGILLDEVIGTPRDYAMSEIKRRITEALTQDDRITSVDDWSFETSGRGVRAKFTVNTIYGDLTAEKEVEI